jgi:two-component system OmpR family response regulator
MERVSHIVDAALTGQPGHRKYRTRVQLDGGAGEFVSADEFTAQMHFRSGGFMPVTALPARAGRPASHATGPGVVAAIRRPATEPAPALTLTVAIPLTDDNLTPQAHKLLEAVRELVEVSQGTVTVTQPPPVRFADPATEGTGPEVRLLTASRQVLLDGVVLPLTRLEFDLLMFLAENPRRVFTRGQLLAGVWGYEHTGERTVDVHVRRLRVKLGGTVPLVTTVYGVGYRLADDARVLLLPHE